MVIILSSHHKQKMIQQDCHELVSQINRWLEKIFKQNDLLSSGLFTSKKIDASSLEELEDALIASDIGPRTAMAIAQDLSKIKFDGEPDADKWRFAVCAGLLRDKLTPMEKPLITSSDNKPHVILLVGVNGSGKTTTCGKLARKFQDDGKSVMLCGG